MDGQTIWLWGIDAPELDQECVWPSGKTMRVGIVAQAALDDAQRSGNLSCETLDVNGHDHAVAHITVTAVYYLSFFDATKAA